MSTYYIFLSFFFPLLVILTDAVTQIAKETFSISNDYLNLREQLYATQDKVRKIELKVEINE